MANNEADERFKWDFAPLMADDQSFYKKVDELVDLIAGVKYNSLTTYYDVLFTNIVNEYIDDNKINEEKLNLACEMMNTYYPGVDGISNIFYAI